ncbi:MAG: LysR family transcriptional regulator, partial [Christensenellales bacterium]|nr:LysR family transcriptional regulator [Christensenellales bacterium]
MLDPKLESLIAVQESGSFTRAAETLSLTQPAISQHVKQLEKELGVRLFFRSEGQLKPTEEGKIVLKYARRMMVLDQNLRVALEDHKRQLKRFSIGLTPTAENRAMTEVLAQYCNDHAGNLYNRLKSYELDAAVVEGHLNDPSLNSILLDTDSIMLAVSNESPLAKKSSVTLEELRRQPMILRLPSSGTRNLFVAHLESRGLHIEDFNLDGGDVIHLQDLVRSNFGVSILARSACMDELRKGKITLLPVENLSIIRETTLIYQRDFSHKAVLDE